MTRRSFAVMTAASTAGALLLGMAQAQAQAQASEPLSLNDALRLAEATSPALRAKTSARTALLDEAAVARTRPDPVLSLGFVNLPVTTRNALTFNTDDMTMKTIGIAQELTRNSKRTARSEALRAEADVTSAEQGLLLSDLRREVMLAWFDVAFARQANDMLRGLADAAHLDREAAIAAYRGGQRPRTDVAEAEVQIAAIEDRILVNRRDVAVAQARLARWLGTMPTTDVAALPDLASLPVTDTDRHPAVAIATARQDQAEAERRVAIAERQTDPTVEAGLGQRDSGRSQMFSLTVRLPLPLNRGRRQDVMVSAQTARVAQFTAEREEAARAATGELAEAAAAWRIDRERLAHHRMAMEPAAAARVDAAVAGYRGGTGVLADVIAARRGRFDAGLETLAIAAEVARNWARLAALAPPAQGDAR